MTGWILYKKSMSKITPEAYEIRRILEEGKKMGIKLKVFCPEEFELLISKDKNKSILINSQIPELPDFVLPRLGSSTTYFGLAIIRQLEKAGVICINSSQGTEESKDKLFSQQILAEKKLPVPKTMLAKFPIDATLIKTQLGFPVVVKTLSGTMGKGVFLIKAKEEFSDIMDLVETTSPTANIILQEFIKESFGVDIRVLIVGGLPVCAMERKGKNGSFKANFSTGGSVKSLPLTPEMKWISSEAAKALHLEIAGVDLLYTKTGLKICEVNSSPGFEGMEQCSEINVAKTILDFIKIRIGNDNLKTKNCLHKNESTLTL